MFLNRLYRLRVHIICVTSTISWWLWHGDTKFLHPLENSVGIFTIKEKILRSQGATQKIHKNFTFKLSDNKPNCFEVFSEIHKSLNKFALNRSVTLHKNSTVFSPYCTTNIHSPLCTYCTMDWYSTILRSITLYLVTFNPKIGSNHP